MGLCAAETYVMAQSPSKGGIFKTQSQNIDKFSEKCSQYRNCELAVYPNPKTFPEFLANLDSNFGKCLQNVHTIRKTYAGAPEGRRSSGGSLPNRALQRIFLEMLLVTGYK